MKSMNKDGVKYRLQKSILLDKCDLPVVMLNNMRIELVNLLKKYMSIESSDVRLSVKVLNDEKFIVSFQCKTDGFVLKK